MRLTSFDADDGAPEAQGDGEALPDIDHPVEQTVLCVQVGDHALLLLQRLQTHTNVCERAQTLVSFEGGGTHSEKEVRLHRHAHFLAALLHLQGETEVSAEG